VYLADESVPGFRDFHTRLQPWIMFFIDAASYIDIDDNNWRFFTL
jgi:histone acetyltransferase 1